MRLSSVLDGLLSTIAASYGLDDLGVKADSMPRRTAGAQKAARVASLEMLFCASEVFVVEGVAT